MVTAPELIAAQRMLARKKMRLFAMTFSNLLDSGEPDLKGGECLTD
jgi:hypothetical protein